MNKNWISLISVILLCGTFIVCTSIIVMNQSNPSKPLSTSSGESISPNSVLNLEEAATYLRISTDTLRDVIKQDEEKRVSVKSTHAYDFIPYAYLNGDLIFYRPNLDKWVDFHTLNK